MSEAFPVFGEQLVNFPDFGEAQVAERPGPSTDGQGENDQYNLEQDRGGRKYEFGHVRLFRQGPGS